MKWIYDTCGNAVLEEVVFAGMSVPAILEARRPLLRRRGTLRTPPRASWGVW